MTFSDSMITEDYPGAKPRNIAEKLNTKASNRKVEKRKTKRRREERAHKFSRKELENWGS